MSNDDRHPLYVPNKDLVFKPSHLVNKANDDERRIIKAFGIKVDKNGRMPGPIRSFIVQREGELHRFDCEKVLRRVLDRIKKGSRPGDAVEAETKGMSDDQMKMLIDAMQGAVGVMQFHRTVGERK